MDPQNNTWLFIPVKGLSVWLDIGAWRIVCTVFYSRFPFTFYMIYIPFCHVFPYLLSIPILHSTPISSFYSNLCIPSSYLHSIPLFIPIPKSMFYNYTNIHIFHSNIYILPSPSSPNSLMSFPKALQSHLCSGSSHLLAHLPLSSIQQTGVGSHMYRYICMFCQIEMRLILSLKNDACTTTYF